MTTLFAKDSFAVHPHDDRLHHTADSVSTSPILVSVEQPQPTITLSPPPDPTLHRSSRRKRSFRNLFASDKQHKEAQQQKDQPVSVSAIGRRLSNLSLKSPQSSRPPSPSSDSPTVGAAAVAASLAAALAVGNENGKPQQQQPQQLLHPNAAYERPPSPSSSSTVSSPGTSPTTMFAEMKRALSQYQQVRHLSQKVSGRRASRSSDGSVTPTHTRAQPMQLDDKYGEHRKGRVVGHGATAVIRLLECLDGKPAPVVAVKAFRKRDRDETEKDYHKRMTSEFCISKALRHTHIVEMFDLVKDHKNRWCSVMEYVSYSTCC